MKRILIFALCACMLLTCFTGCGEKKGPSKSLEELGYQYEDPAKPIVKEKGTAKYRVISQKNAMADNYNDMKVFKDLYDSTYVDVNWENLSASQYAVQKQLIMQDKKNWPDAIYHAYFSDAEIIRYATRKTFIAIDEYLEYMPNLSAILEKRPDIKKIITMPDGHFYSLPRVEEMGLVPYPNLLFLNKEWVGDLIDQGKINFLTKADLKDGLDLTIDQMETILRLFKNNDMNGNGKNDEIPLSFVFQNWQGNQTDLWGAFGVPDNVDHRTVIDGKVVCTATMDGFKEATNFYADWVTEGLIDKASFEYSEESFLASGKAPQQKLGAFYWWESETVVTDPENYIVLNPLKGTDGTQMIGLSNSPEISKCLCVIFSTCENPEILLTYFDRFYEPYTSAQIVYGPIGIVYEEELDENGKLVQKPIPEGMTADELRLKNAPMGVSYLSDETWENYLNMEPRAVLRLERLEKHAIPFAGNGVETLPNPSFTLEELNFLGQYEQNVYDFIIGSLTDWLLHGGVTDAEYEQFKKDLENLNLSGVLEAYQNGYERTKA